MKNLKWLCIFLLFVISSCKNENKLEEDQKNQVNYLKESKKSFDKRMEWWRDARFGMFIHWGPYAVPAGLHNGEEIDGLGEWIMNRADIPVSEYEKYAMQFNPTDFNAEKWAKLMKEAGIKYVVITSKHHDGFGMWDSKVSNYNIVDFSAYGEDILKKLSEACKKEGIKFGLYYSIMDWHHSKAQAFNYPDYSNRDSLKVNPEFPTYVQKYLKPQLKELIINYDPEILWFDGEWIPAYTHKMGQDLYQYLRELKPDLIINNRVDKGRQGMQGMNKSDKSYAGDFGTPEQEILKGSIGMDWESCMTMNNTWGYKKNDQNWKSAKLLIHNLIEITAKGGNYLLNVGPTAEGEIPKPSIERLHKIGDWLEINGEAIYGTKKMQKHFKQGEDIRYTTKKDKVYGISLKDPGSNILFEYVKPDKGSEIYLLGYDTPLDYSYSEDSGLKIDIPDNALKAVGEMRAWVFRIQGNERGSIL